MFEDGKDLKKFLRLPSQTIFTVPTKDFDEGLQYNVIDFVDNLPEAKYTYCREMYYHALTGANRQQMQTAALTAAENDQ